MLFFKNPNQQDTYSVD